MSDLACPRAEVDARAYPDAETHRRRWRRLAREIAAHGERISDDPASITVPERPGTLEILGSGIEAVGFTRADEMRIRDADEVFFCVADPATKVWLLELRPDAYDLYVLYDDAKRRYVTYMQMTEAMLHGVRQGRRVAAVFYGHPGVFVLATHRAVQIARREGHRAEMRAAVSALDTLCADLGVDPSQPGMQMYEATDMLIRSRKPDPGLHLVLWQVGLIGELGYRRQGYLNSNFSVLLDYLEELYGPDHEVVNYVGSRYPGIAPVIDRQTLASLRDPTAQGWVTGISTFYLPPLRASASDPVMLERLGLIRPGQRLRENVEALRVIDRYGQRERQAFADFARFDVPQSYQWQPDTAAARFVLALCDSEPLREAYRADPDAALAAWPGQLSGRERALLRQREPGAIQLAAKGFRAPGAPENRQLAEHLLERKSASGALLATVKRAGLGQVRAAADAWLQSSGLTGQWSTLAADLQQVLRRSLAAWSGLYLMPAQRRTLSVYGHIGGATARVDLDGQRIAGLRFEKGVLRWSAQAGNATSGYLQPDLTAQGRRRWVGLIWPAGTAPGQEHKVVAREHLPRPGLALSAVVGRYLVPRPDGDPGQVALLPGPEGGWIASVDGEPAPLPGVIGAERFQVGELWVPLDTRVPEAWVPGWALGHYHLALRHGAVAEVTPLEIDRTRISLAGRPVAARWRDGGLSWEQGSGAAARGHLSLSLDPITLRPLLHGSVESAGGTGTTVRGMGVIDAEAVTQLRARPRLGLPGWAWEQLLAVACGANASGGLFLWQGYDRASTNLARLGQVLDRLYRDDEASFE